jgi:hypothetical protein
MGEAGGGEGVAGPKHGSFVARMSAATSGDALIDFPGCRCAHPGYGNGPCMAGASKFALAERPEPG